MLEYSDNSSPGGLGGGRGLACACLGLMPSWAQGAHRLLGAPVRGLQCAPNPSRTLGGMQTHRPPLPTLAPSSLLQD